MGRAASRRRRGLGGGVGNTSNTTTGSSRTARFNRRNNRLKSKAGLHPTKHGNLKINWSARDIAKRLTNHKVAKALGLHNLAGKIPKGWKTNINLKTGIKSKIGEPNYRSTSANHPGGGLTQSDIDAYDFYARYNPEGHTISDWEKLYANQIKEGMSLEQAMKHNPAETLSFYALIDDSGSSATDTTNTTTQTTNNNEPMAFDFEKYGIHDPTQFGTGDAQLSHNIDKIYQTLLGRNADSGGRTHWMGDVSSKGDSAYQALVNTILGGKEYKDRAAEVAANPNVTEQELDRLASAYVSPFHTYAGGAAAGYTPADDLTTAVAEAVSGGHQDQTNKTVEEVALANVLHNANNVNAADAINSTIGGLTGITGGVDTKVATDTSGGSGDGTWKKIHDLTKSVLGSGAIDSTAAAKTSHTYKAGDTITTGNGDVIGVSTGDDNKAGGGTNVKTGDGSIVKIDANGKITFNGDDAVVNKDGTVTKTGTSSNWWDSYSDLAALKAALGIGNQTATNTTSDFDQFTKFIGALSGISGLFGGGGGNYGYGGYGGFNPGGVQQASSTDKMTGLLDAFKNMNSTSGGSSASTSTINV